MLSERLMQFIDVDLHGVKVRVTTSCPQKIKHTTEICIYVGSTSGFALLHGYLLACLTFCWIRISSLLLLTMKKLHEVILEM